MAVNKNIGGRSAASNDFLAPLAPINVVGTDVGTDRAYVNGAVSVAFSLPANSPAATSFTVTPSSGTAVTGPSSPIVVTGFASGATPTFTVIATNGSGVSPASSASDAVTVTTVPGVPTSISATSTVNAQDVLSWSEPQTGGKPITSRRWVSSDGKSGTGASPLTIGQEAGTAQTYTVWLSNANGEGLSGTSSSVTTFFAPPVFFGPPVFFAPPAFFSPPAFFGPPGFFAPPRFFGPPGFFAPPRFFAPPGFFAPPRFFAPPGFFSPPRFFAPPRFFFPPPFSVGPETLVKTVDGLVRAENLIAGNEVISLNINSITEKFNDPDYTMNPSEMIVSEEDINDSNIVVSTIKNITIHQKEEAIVINNEFLTKSHSMVVKRNDNVLILNAEEVISSDMIYSQESKSFVPVETIAEKKGLFYVYSLELTPYPFYFTEKTLSFDNTI